MGVLAHSTISNATEAVKKDTFYDDLMCDYW